MTSFVARYVILWSRFDHCETGWLGNWCILVGIRYRLSYLFYTPMVTVSSCTCACTSVVLIARVILYFLFFFFFPLSFFSFFLVFFIGGEKGRILYNSVRVTYMCVLVINYTDNFTSYFLFSLNFILWKQKVN